MALSGPPSYASKSDRENVIQAFQDWRPKDPFISEELGRRNILSRRSVARRVFRTTSFGFIIVFIALTLVLWQSGSQEKAKVVSALHSWVTSLNPTEQHPSGTAAELTTNNKVSQATPSVATPRPVEEEYSAIRQQLDSLTSQLTEMRRIAEQLAANQEKMDEDITALKISEESINKRLSAVPPRQPNVAPAPGKKPQEPARVVSTRHSSSERSSVGPPLPLR